MLAQPVVRASGARLPIRRGQLGLTLLGVAALGLQLQAQSIIYDAPLYTVSGPGGSTLYNAVALGDNGTPGRPAGDHIGNTVTFSGTDRKLVSVDMMLLAFGSGSPRFTLDLYAGANPNTGSLLGSATSEQLTPVFGKVLTFQFGGLAVPDTLTYVISSSTGADPASTPASASGVTVGSAVNSLWYGTAPGNFTQNDTWALADGAPNNYLSATFKAIPEPTVSALAGLAGLGWLAWLGYRRGRK